MREQLAGDGEDVGILDRGGRLVEREQAAGGDARGDTGPRLGELDDVILECLILGARRGNVERGVTTHGEGHIGGARVGDGEGLGKRGLARDGIGHVELELVRIRLERLGRAGELESHRRAILGHLGDTVLVNASETVARHAACALGALSLIAAQGADNGEQHRGVFAPKRRVRLPQILAAVEREARELGALGAYGGGKTALGDGRVRHGETFRTKMEAHRAPMMNGACDAIAHPIIPRLTPTCATGK